MPIDWEEVARREETERTAPRRTGTFVAAPPWPVRPSEMMPATPQVIDMSPAWQPMTSPSRDSTSAMDRARAFHVRSAPAYLSILGMAIIAVIMYSTSLWFFKVDTGAPWFADRFLIFLGVVFIGGMVTFVRLNETDYAHSHHGVERLRIQEAADIQRTVVEAELEIKREALRAYLRLLEDKER